MHTEKAFACLAETLRDGGTALRDGRCGTGRLLTGGGSCRAPWGIASLPTVLPHMRGAALLFCAFRHPVILPARFAAGDFPLPPGLMPERCFFSAFIYAFSFFIRTPSPCLPGWAQRVVRARPVPFVRRDGADSPRLSAACPSAAAAAAACHTLCACGVAAQGASGHGRSSAA